MSLFRVEGATPDENDESKEHSLAARLAAVRATAEEAQTTVDESAADAEERNAQARMAARALDELQERLDRVEREKSSLIEAANLKATAAVAEAERKAAATLAFREEAAKSGA